MYCRTMINMFDTNQTGTIDMNEFGRLFAYIQQWKAMFENFDRDRLDGGDDHDHDHDHYHDHDGSYQLIKVREVRIVIKVKRSDDW